MKLLFTICGRAGSKGIRNKNARLFCGKPLVYYSLSVIDLFLKNHPDIEFTIVASSDSQELLKQISKNGKRVVDLVDREAYLSGDNIGKIEVIRDCLDRMVKKYLCKYDYVFDLDITSPLRTVNDLEMVYETHISTNADVTTTVAHARRNPYFNQVMRANKGVKKVIESNYTARQQAPQIYDMNASIYAYKPSFLRSGKNVLDGYCEVVEMLDTGILDLDEENDFVLMEVIANHLFKTSDEYCRVYESI